MLKHKVVLVPFPFDDLSGSKVRPAVCLTESIGPHAHVILAFITSRVPDSPLPSDIIIEQNQTDFASTGLQVASTIQLHRLMTVSQMFLRRELGILSPSMKNEINNKLRNLFELETRP